MESTGLSFTHHHWFQIELIVNIKKKKINLKVLNCRYIDIYNNFNLFWKLSKPQNLIPQKRSVFPSAVAQWMIVLDFFHNTNYHPAKSQPATNIPLWNSSVQWKSDISSTSNQEKLQRRNLSCPVVTLIHRCSQSNWLLFIYFSSSPSGFSSCRHHSRGMFPLIFSFFQVSQRCNVKVCPLDGGRVFVCRVLSIFPEIPAQLL